MENLPESSRDKPPSEPLLASAFPVLMMGFSLDVNVTVALVASFFLLIASALVSGSEVAYFSISPKQLVELGKEKSSPAKKILALLKKPDFLLATILVANNLFNIGLVLCTSYLMNQLIDFSQFSRPNLMEFVINSATIVPILVLFGEVFPKIYATRYNLKLAKLMSVPLHWMDRLFAPLSFVLVNSTQLIQNRMRKKKEDVDFKEIGEVIDLLVTDEKTGKTQQMLKGIVEFANITVSQIQQARVNVLAIEKGESFEELQKLVKTSSYSRIPVYEGDLDKILGIVYAKELLGCADMGANFDWSPLIKENVVFVPESKKIDDMLKVFKETRQHMAFVVDEYGGTAGIVTLEDVVERVVGDIQDEYDRHAIRPTRLKDGSYSFDANVPLIDLCKHFGVDFDTFDEVRGESESIGGLLLEIEGGFPEVNRQINCNDFIFTVLNKSENRIEKVKVRYLNEKKDTPVNMNKAS